jgi:hypothetical protein
MADRIIVWYFPTLPAKGPAYYIEQDYSPTALRIHTEVAPGGDLQVNIFDDGVSILRSSTTMLTNIKLEDPYIEFGTPTGTFRTSETITGGTSSATAKVKKVASGKLTLMDVSGIFTVGETITGATSAATGVVNAYVREIRSVSNTSKADEPLIILYKNESSSSSAANFTDGTAISEGSWLTCTIPDAAGAKGITVQLELNSLP